MPIHDDVTHPSEKEMAAVFEEVSKKHPNHDVSYMKGPFNRYSSPGKDWTYMDGWAANRKDYPENTRFLVTKGVGFAIAPKK